MTIVVPVKNKNGTVIGTAAVDVALATLFSEIQDFVYGVYSYAFLLEKMHGKYCDLIRCQQWHSLTTTCTILYHFHFVMGTIFQRLTTRNLACTENLATVGFVKISVMQVI